MCCANVAGSDKEVENANLVEPTESFEVQKAAKSEPSGTAPIIQEPTTEGQGDANAQEHYYTAAMQYTPKMYDRSHGWTGQTYEEAIAFCKNAADGMAVCPYDALCPEGVGSEPLGGYRGGPHGDWAWIPVSDRFNEWVQAGAREECVRYSHKFGVDPEWGVTGKGIETELVTQVSHYFVACYFCIMFSLVPFYQFIPFLTTFTECDVLSQCSLKGE